MNIICLEEPALFELVNKLTDYVKEKLGTKEDKWISPEEAMRLLRISSPTTLANLRNSGKIAFSHPERKIILYDRESIDAYILKHYKKTF